MDQKVMDSLRVKPKEEIVEQLREIIHRHRRRFIAKNMRPCPENCTKAEVTSRGVQGCPGCQSRNPEQCRDQGTFVAIATRDDLYHQFREMLRDPEVLRHDYRDIMTLLWVLGEFDGDEVPDSVMTNVETRQINKGKG